MKLYSKSLSATFSTFLALAKRKNFSRVALAISLAGAFSASKAEAANGPDMWVGNTSANWADPNWSGANNPPVSGDSLTFGVAGTSGTTLSDNLMTPSVYTVTGITFNAGASAFTINAASGTNGFTLTNGITNNSTSLETVNDNIVLSGTDTMTTTSGGGNLTLGGGISGTGAMVTAGTGTTTINNYDTFSGGTTVNGGTLALNVGGGNGAIAGNLTINSAGTVQLTAGDALGYATGGAVGTVYINGGVLNNATGNNEGYITNFVLTGGSMTSTGGGQYNLNGTSISSLASGTTSTISSGILLRGGTITINTATGTTASGVDLNITNTINGGSSIVKNGTGTLEFSNNNYSSGGLTINGGTVITSDNGAQYGALGTGTVTINSGATLQSNSGDSFGYYNGTPAALNVVGGTITTGGTGNFRTTLPNLILTGGTLTSATGNNGDGSGTFSLNAGESVTSVASSTTSTISAVNLGLDGSIGFNVASGTTASGVDLLVSSNIVNAYNSNGAIAKTGTGLLELTGNNSYNGASTITAGTLQFGNGVTNSSLGGGTYAISAPGRLYLDYATTNTPPYANITGAGTLELNTAQEGGWGNAALGTNFTGTLTVDRGRVQGAANFFGDATTINIGNGAQLGIFDVVNQSTANDSFTFTQNMTIGGYGWGETGYNYGAIRNASPGGTTTSLNGNILLTSNSGLETNTNALIVNGIISDGGNGYGLEFHNDYDDGGGTGGAVELAAANTYSGDTLVDSGQLQLNNTLAIQDSVLNYTSGAVVFNTGTTTNDAFTTGGLSGTANLNLQDNANQAVALTVGNNAGLNGTELNSTYTGGLSGSGSIIKVGTGTQTFAGANSYSGGTTVNGGTLVFAAGSTMTGGGGISLNGSATNPADLILAGSYTGGGNIQINNTASVVDIASGANVTAGLETSYGSDPTVNIAGNLNVSGERFILNSGTFTQTAGNVNAGDSLVFNDNYTGTTGTYYLGGGSLAVGQGPYGSLILGGRGLADFYVSQTGSLTVTGATQAQLAAGNNGEADNSWNQIVIGSAYGGSPGTSVFVQQGGTVTTNGVVLGDLNNQNASGGTTNGTYYLNAGTLTTGQLAAVHTTGTFVFGGGTLKSSAAFSTAASGGGNLITQINSGGATIDTTNGSVTWNSAITAGTTGNVVAPTSVTPSGSGYTTPPTVTVTGNGTGATAVAELNQAGQVVDVVVTNPGSGYSGNVTFSFSTPTGGTAATSFTTTAATGNGGLTVQGGNSLILNGANTYTGDTAISSGTLVVGSTGSLGAGSYNGNISNAGTFNVGETGNQTLSGVVSGAGAFVQSGTGTTTLTGADTFTGPVSITAGNLTVGAAGSLGGGTYAGKIGNAGTFNVGETANQTLSGVISGAGTLVQSGTGTTTLTGVNTFTGPTVITGGGLVLAGAGQLGSGNYAGTISDGTQLVYGSSAAQTLSGVISGGGSLVENGPGTLTVSAANTYSGGTSVNSGTLTIANTSGSATGTGDVAVASAATLSGSGSIAGSLTVAGGGAIDLRNGASNDTIAIGGGLTIGGATGNASDLFFDAGSGSNTADTLSITGALTVNAGGGQITINNLNNSIVAGQTYVLATFASGSGAGFALGSGETTIGDITLTDPSLGVGVDGTLTVTNNEIELVTTGAQAPTTAYWKGASGSTWISTGAGGATNFTTDAAGTSPSFALPNTTTDVIFAASGATNLTNTLGQSFDIKGISFLATDASGVTIGAVQIGTLAGGNTLALEGDGITDNNANGVTFSPTTLTPSVSQTWANNSAAALTVNSAVTGVRNTSTTVTLEANGAGAIDINGVIANGPGGQISLVVNSAGSGSVVLAGANTFTGTTQAEAGNLDLANQYALQDSVLNLAGGSVTFDSVVAANDFNLGGVTGTGTLNLSNNAATPNAINLTLGGISSSFSSNIILTGAGSLTKVGTGTATFTGANTYAGATAVNGGVLAEGTLDPNSALAFNGGTLNYTGGSVTYVKGITVGANGGEFDTATAGATTTISTGSVTTSGNFTTGGAGNFAISSVIGGSGGLSATTTGTVSLTGVNTYTGDTAIGAGSTLNLDGAGQLGAGSYAGNIANAGTFNFNSSATQTLSGVISGTGALTQAGSGTTTLAGVNTFTAPVSINGGVLVASNVAAVGMAQSLGESNTVNINGGTLRITEASVPQTANFATNYNIGANGGTLDAAAALGGGFIFNGGSISGTGLLTFLDSATSNSATFAQTWLLTGNSPNFSGNVEIGNGQTNSGWVQNRQLGANPLGTGTITINGGGILSADAQFTQADPGPGVLSNNIILNGGALTTQSEAYVYTGTVTLEANTTSLIGWSNNQTAALTISNGIIDGAIGSTDIAANLTVGAVAGTQTNTATFDGVNTFSGNLTLGSGGYNTTTLIIGGAGQLSSLAAPGTYAGQIALGNNTLFNYASSANDVLSGSISGSGGLTMSGSGTLTLGGVNSYGGATNVTGGTLLLTNGGNSTSGFAIGAGGTLRLTTSADGTTSGSLGSGSYDGTIVDNGTFDFDVDGGQQSLTGVISGTGGVSVTSGYLTVNAAETYTGTTTIGPANPGAGSGPAQAYLLVGDGANLGGSLAASGTIVDNGYLVFQRPNEMVQGVDFSSSAISGVGGLIVLQTGASGQSSAVVLNAQNTYSGGTILLSGIAQVDAAQTTTSGPLGTGSIDFDGGTLQYTAANNYDYSALFTAGAFDGPGTPGLSYSVDTNGQNVTFGSALADGNQLSAGFIVSDSVGTGTLTSTASNTYSGETVINTGATLQLGNGMSGKDGSITNSSDVVNNGSLIYNQYGSNSYGGVISGVGSVSKLGVGTQTLTADNTYSGGTTVSAGKLFVNNPNDGGSGTGTGNVLVQSGATFGGSGSVAPTSGTGVTVQSGGTLASGGVQTSDAVNTTVTGTGLTLDNSAGLSKILSVDGGATLTFALGGAPSTGYKNYASPNLNGTYDTVVGDNVGEVTFGLGTAINVDLVDLTALSTALPQPRLALAYDNPYLLIDAGLDSDYANLVTSGGLDQDGFVLGVGTSLTDYTAFNIDVTDINGSPISTPYKDLSLYLYQGKLEVIPEPGTWALMLAGLLALVGFARRRSKVQSNS